MADKPTSNEAERMDANAVEVVGSQVKAVTVGGVEYEIVQAVNLPTLKHDSGVTVGMRIDAAMIADTNEEGKTLFVMRVTELSTMQQFNYVLNSITVGNLNSAYPEHTYVGRMFAIHKGGTVAGKRYKDVRIVEISPKA